MVENMLEGIEVRLNVDYLENKEELDTISRKSSLYRCRLMLILIINWDIWNIVLSVLKHELLDKPNFQGNAAVNYTDRETPWTRIIEHKWFEFGKDEDGNDLPKTYYF